MRNKVGKHLGFLNREGKIEYWYDGKIKAGEEWRGEIDRQLDSADIILLLISADFVDSDFCYSVEMKRAMERHDAGEAAVIPILLHPCDWHSAPFGKLNALPEGNPISLWPNPEQALHEVAKGVRVVVEGMIAARSAAQPPPPMTEVVSAPSLRIPPPPVIEFVPREDREGRNIIERLREELAPHKNRLIALWGAGGVGKTAIAAEAARALTEAFNQRVAWVSADGREDFSLTFLLDGVATQLGHPDLRKLAPELKKEQVSELVMAAPTLVVLDNFETIEPQEKNLCAAWLAQPALCSALITTRQNIELETARNIPVKSMSPGEAHVLLDRLLTEVHNRRAFSNLDRDRVITTAEANPLVLQWVVGQIDLAQDPEEVLDDLAHGEGTAAQRVFNRSYNLPQLATGGRAVLLALSLFVPSATRSALAEVGGMGKDKDRKRFKEAVKNLSALWLVRVTEDQRLAVEGLTRELTKARLSIDPRSKTFRQRFVSRFLHYANTHEKPTPSNFDMLEAEKDNILAAMDIAFEMKDWANVVRIMWAINFDGVNGLLSVRGYWDEAIRRSDQALEAARSLKNEMVIAGLAHSVAVMHQLRGELAEARRLYDESLEISKRHGDQSGAASTLHQLGRLAEDQGDLAEARRLYDESLGIKRRLGDQSGTAGTLNQLGNLARDKGDLAEARRLYDESLGIKRRLGNQSGIAVSLRSLGTLAQERKDYDEARRLYDESFEIGKSLGSQSGIAYSLHQLGTLHFDEEDFGTAENLLNQSLVRLRKLGDKQNIAECLESIGKLRVKQERYSEAQILFAEALEIAGALGIPFRIANVKHSLGLLEEKQGNRERAAQLFGEALSLFEKLGVSKKGMARGSLERVMGKSS
jgi:tetratricopeptide (TPR) repeat protein